MKAKIIICSFCLLVLNTSFGQTCDPNDPPASLDYIRLEFKGPQNEAVATAKAIQTFTEPWAKFANFWVKTDAASSIVLTEQSSTLPLYKVDSIYSDDPFIGEPAGHKYTFFGGSAAPFDPSVVFPLNTEVFLGKFKIFPPSNTVELVMTDIVPPVNLGTWFYYRCAITFCLPRYKDNLIAPTQNLPLPIILTAFKANKVNESQVKLDWVTSSEINSDYFAIERSQNGKEWTEVGTVAAAGNSLGLKSYEFYDYLPEVIKRNSDPYLYYKLRMVDLDGKEVDSDIRVVHFNQSFSDGSFAIYPNPSLQYFNIDLSETDATYGDLTLKVFDMLGKQVVERKVLGGGIELLDMENHPAGLYEVRITQGYKYFHSRISKL
ncbi:MAG: T9SS type A sorting domain-containing protein [Chitinophagales bacterium]|nr:T9SS type A sorting domain-containing protein [Chitinophagales bacterium]